MVVRIPELIFFFFFNMTLWKKIKSTEFEYVWLVKLLLQCKKTVFHFLLLIKVFLKINHLIKKRVNAY